MLQVAQRADVPRRAKVMLFAAPNLIALTSLYDYEEGAPGPTPAKRSKLSKSAGRDTAKRGASNVARIFAEDGSDSGPEQDGAAVAMEESGDEEAGGATDPEENAEEDPDLVGAAEEMQVASADRADAGVDGDAGADADADAQRHAETIPQQCHRLLLLVCSDPSVGICYVVPADASGVPQAALLSSAGQGDAAATAAAVAWRQGWDRDNVANRSLLHVLGKLWRTAHDGARRELVLAMLGACPDLFPHFMKFLVAACESRISFKSLAAMRLAYSAALLPPPSLYVGGVAACVDHRIESAVPEALERHVTTKGFTKDAPPLLMLTCCKSVLACLQRVEAVLAMVHQEVRQHPNLAGPWLEFEDVFLSGVRKRLPDIQGVVAALPRAAPWPLLHALLLQVIEGYQTHLPSSLAGLNLERLLAPPAVHTQLHPAVRAATYAALSRARGLQWSSQPKTLLGGDTPGEAVKGAQMGAIAAPPTDRAPALEEDAQTRFGVLLHTAAFTTHHRERLALQKLALAALEDTGAFTGELAHEMGAWIAHLPAHARATQLLEELYIYLCKNPWRLAPDPGDVDGDAASVAPCSPMLRRALQCWQDADAGAESAAFADLDSESLVVLVLYVSRVVADVEAAAAADRGRPLSFSRLAEVWGAPRIVGASGLGRLGLAALRLANIVCGRLPSLSSDAMEDAPEDGLALDHALEHLQQSAAALEDSDKGALLSSSGATVVSNAIAALCRALSTTPRGQPLPAMALENMLSLAQRLSPFAVGASTTLFFVGLLVSSERLLY